MCKLFIDLVSFSCGHLHQHYNHVVEELAENGVSGDSWPANVKRWGSRLYRWPSI